MGTAYRIRKCKNCGVKFKPIYSSLQYTCSFDCAKIYGKKMLEKINEKERKEIKKSLLTHKDYLKALQKVFNSYIRLRDKNKPCISCKKPLKSKFDAGHFFSVGGYPNVRFDLDNVHGQCVYCNQYYHGNIHEFKKGIIERIGVERFEALEIRAKQTVTKLSIEEIKEKIAYYKGLIKDLQNN